MSETNDEERMVVLADDLMDIVYDILGCPDQVTLVTDEVAKDYALLMTPGHIQLMKHTIANLQKLVDEATPNL